MTVKDLIARLKQLEILNRTTWDEITEEEVVQSALLR